jgi:MMP 1-O-methyltransferase
MEPVFSALQYVFDFARYEEELHPVGGFLNSLEGYTLMLLASEGPAVGEIVEIGSYMGRSTCFLAKGSKSMRREKVTAVDHFVGSPEHQKDGSAESPTLLEEGTTFNRFQANIEAAGVADYVTPIVASSEEGVQDWNQPIRLLFIDGDHSYEESKKDFELWSPYVVPGGLVCFHDIEQWPGVTQFYKELIATNLEFEGFFTALSLAIVQKRIEPPQAERGRPEAQ